MLSHRLRQGSEPEESATGAFPVRDTMPAVLRIYPVWDKIKLTYPVSM